MDSPSLNLKTDAIVIEDAVNITDIDKLLENPSQSFSIYLDRD